MKNFKTISTLLVGIVIGLAISFSPQIQAAADKLVGQKVTKTMDVKLNDKSIGQAAVIGGTSYLPVRALTENLGVDVGVDNTEIKLKTLEDTGRIQSDSGIPQKDQELARTKKIEMLKSRIVNTQKDTAYLKELIDQYDKTLTSEQKSENGLLEVYREKVSKNEAIVNEAQQELLKLEIAQ